MVGIVVCGYLGGCEGRHYPEVAETEFRGHPTTASPRFTREPLSPAVALGIQHYLAETTPIAFTIEENGRFFVSWVCDQPCDYDIDVELPEAIGHCERERVGSRCYVAYAGSTRSSDIRFASIAPHHKLQAEHTRLSGPDRAKGAIAYFPGFSGWHRGYHNGRPSSDSAYVPPLYLRLNERGWDIYRVNFENQHDRSAMWRNEDEVGKLVGQNVDELRARDYERIVLAGQSRGAAEVLLATAHGVEVDAVIVNEPNDSGGALTRAGEENEGYEDQAAEMYGRILSSNTPRTVLMYFESSFWTRDFSEYVKEHPTPKSILLIEKPHGFRGHSAAGSERFAGHAECISEYLLGNIEGYDECRLPDHDPTDIKYWQTRDQIVAAGLEPPSAAEVAVSLMGNTLCQFDWDEERVSMDWQCGYFAPGFRIKDSNIKLEYPYNNYGAIEYVEGGYCKHDGFGMYTDLDCVDVFFDADKVFVVSRQEDDGVMLVILPGNQIKTHDVVCASVSKGIRCEMRGSNETPVQAGSRIARSMK